jgi:hypothetical protein
LKRANTVGLASRIKDSQEAMQAHTSTESAATPQRWPSSLPPFPAFCQELVGLFEDAKKATAGAGNLGAQPAWLAKSDPSSFGFAGA